MRLAFCWLCFVRPEVVRQVYDILIDCEANVRHGRAGIHDREEDGVRVSLVSLNREGVSVMT